MRRVITETIKICILGILILISLIILEMIYEPVSVKANRVLGQGKYIGHEFTKEEMDEYMIYLKSGKIFKHTLEKLELPLEEEKNEPIIYTIEDWNKFVRSRRLNTNIWPSKLNY